MIEQWIALNSVRGLGPVRIRHLLDAFGTPEQILAQSHTALMKIPGITRQSCETMTHSSLLDHAADQIDKANRNGVQIISLQDASYPPLLKEIFAPPPVLYIKGNPAAFNTNAIGIVGTRRPTSYGKDAARQIAVQLAERKVTIVSGLALGIDTIAHSACVEHNTPTIAVLGCGIDRIYPKSNEKLFDQIAACGAIVSEFPMGTPPEAYNFPRRNRIISGLSAGILVVEAGQRSGSLITANYALQQNRDVYAVPGSIFSAMSSGTFNLIKNGAVPVRSAEDIIDSMSVITNHELTRCEQAPIPTFPAELLAEEERKLLNALDAEPLRLDQLADILAQPVAELFNMLLNLELKGLIRQSAGQVYEKAHMILA